MVILEILGILALIVLLLVVLYGLFLVVIFLVKFFSVAIIVIPMLIYKMFVNKWWAWLLQFPFICLYVALIYFEGWSGFFISIGLQVMISLFNFNLNRILTSNY
ncbi:MAG: hypothetical protein Q4G16_09700 [Cruoricaptor ignavus]|nr:hypothetical protein [Cruoricaptor ignavus]